MVLATQRRRASSRSARPARTTAGRSRRASSPTETIRCPWHHACFDLRTGDAVRAPAFAPVACYRVERERRTGPRGRAPAGGRRRSPARPARRRSVVIVGAGAAAYAAADTLRREGFGGNVTLIGAEDTGPVDRPNLSKEYLAGKAPEEWIPLRRCLRRGRAADRHARRRDRHSRAALSDWPTARPSPGTRCSWRRAPSVIRLDVPGPTSPTSTRCGRSPTAGRSSRRRRRAKRAVVVGASFIGLEVAASLRERGVAVDVVAPDRARSAKILGPEVGAFVEGLHEEHGVVFHLGDGVASISTDAVRLTSGGTLPADLVVVGIGVRPRHGPGGARGAPRRPRASSSTSACRRAPRASSPPATSRAGPTRGSAGPSASSTGWWPSAWGPAAARSILGRPAAFRDVPFFWSAHYDATLDVRRPRRAVGPHRRPRQPRGARRHARLSRGRPDPRRGHDRTRSRRASRPSSPSSRTTRPRSRRSGGRASRRAVAQDPRPTTSTGVRRGARGGPGSARCR